MKKENAFIDQFFRQIDLDRRIKIPSSYRKAIEIVYDAAVTIWELEPIQRFTDHSIQHSLSILEHALNIAKGLKNPLTKQEIFVLTVSCFLHDIGMQYGHYAKKNEETGEPEEEDWNKIRLYHADRSLLMLKALFGIQKELNMLEGFQATLTPLHRFLSKENLNIIAIIEQLSCIILAHTKDGNRKETGWFNANCHPDRKDLRLSFIAALVRISDELDLGQKRITDYEMFERKGIPINSLEHWIAASLVASVEIEVKESAICVTINPDYSIIPTDQELSDFSFFIIFRCYKKIVRSLMKPIISGTPTIADIFLQHDISLRILPPTFNEKGLLGEESTNISEESNALKKVYENMAKDGFHSDAFSINIYDFPRSPTFSICLIEEANGLRIPSAFKNRIVDWVKNSMPKQNKNTNYHTSFHRISEERSTLEEYLPNKSVAPFSVLGLAAATKAYSYDITKIKLLPIDIECSTRLLGDTIYIDLPQFTRPTNFKGDIVKALRPHDVVKIEYIPPGGDDNPNDPMKSMIYGLVTSLGDTTFLTIPSDQDIINGPKDGNILLGAGIKNFFIDLEDILRNGKDKQEWKKTREKLLRDISETFRINGDISGRLVSSIIGYEGFTKSYKVITWQEKKVKLPEYIHIGVVAASLYLLDLDNRDDFIDEPLFVHPEVFPNDNEIKVELWCGVNSRQKSEVKVSKPDDSLSVALEVNKKSEIKNQTLI